MRKTFFVFLFIFVFSVNCFCVDYVDGVATSSNSSCFIDYSYHDSKNNLITSRAFLKDINNLSAVYPVLYKSDSKGGYLGFIAVCKDSPSDDLHISRYYSDSGVFIHDYNASFKVDTSFSGYYVSSWFTYVLLDDYTINSTSGNFLSYVDTIRSKDQIYNLVSDFFFQAQTTTETTTETTTQNQQQLQTNQQLNYQTVMETVNNHLLIALGLVVLLIGFPIFLRLLKKLLSLF